MGRLFWKFFFILLLVQSVSVLGVNSWFWWERHYRPEAALHHAPDGDKARPPHRHRRGIPTEPLVGGLFASLVAATLIARHFSRPIRTLRAAFETTATGKLDVRIGDRMGNRNDELSDLGRKFDTMANRLESLLDAQRRLLHDVSHELRSPLARLQASIGLARQNSEHLEQTLQRIEVESIRMDRMIDELLTLSRLEAGASGEPAEDIYLNELLAGIVDDASLEAQGRAMSLRFEPGDECVLSGSSQMLHRAVENIVRNAIKFSPEKSEILIRCEALKQTGEAKIWIRDQGPGVPEQDLDVIFEPFHRGSAPRNGNGHGLGLAIAKRVIESMHGQLTATNLSGGGFCVQINLPANQIASRPGIAAM